MSNSLTQVALSGIRASQVGLNITGQNIANAQTPGFSRQSIVQAAGEPMFTGSGYVGSGTRVDGIKRAYSSLLQAQFNASVSEAARAKSHAEGISQINAILGDVDRGASHSIDAFFAAVQQVTASPADLTARQSMLASAQTLTQRFRDLDISLTDQRRQINDRLEVAVKDVNSFARQIAVINARITNETASGRDPNDLLDQRDMLQHSLNQLVRTTSVANDDGSINIYLTSGVTLVSGGLTQDLAIEPNAMNPMAPLVGVKTGATALPLPGAADFGGEIGGLILQRDDALTLAEAGVGRLARVIADTINARLRLGIDLGGAGGGDLFAVAAPAAVASADNRGSASLAIEIIDVSALQPSDYRIARSADGYTVTRLSDGRQSNFAGLPADLDGLRLTVQGQADIGDNFLASPARGAAATLQVALREPARIAAGFSLGVTPAQANSGSAVASLRIDDAGFTQSDPVTVTFETPQQVTIGSAAGPVSLAYTAGTPIAFNGWSLSLQGTVRAGDAFVVAPLTGAIGDNRNLLALSGLSAEAVIDGASFTGAYAQLVAEFGVRGREADAASRANASLAETTASARNAVSGVSLEEEAMNMLRYQQAYQAAGKLLSVSNTLFDAILQAAR